MTGLRPATRYESFVQDLAPGAGRGVDCSFKTSPERAEVFDRTFAVVGDSGKVPRWLHGGFFKVFHYTPALMVFYETSSTSEIRTYFNVVHSTSRW